MTCFIGFYLLLLLFALSQTEAKLSVDGIVQAPFNDYLKKLGLLLTEILTSSKVQRCFAVITDDLHYDLYERKLFGSRQQLLPFYMIKVGNLEDLLAPRFRTIQILKDIKNYDCDLHVVTLLNGLQTKRFLYFIDKFNILNTQQRFVLLHDVRIFEADMLHIWTTMISTVFLQRNIHNSFKISTIAYYPGVLSGTLVLKQLGVWRPGNRIRNKELFPDKTVNLKGAKVPVAIFEHMPMVYWSNTTQSYEGVEIELIKALGGALKFKPHFYKTFDSETERWGKLITNGSHTGLIGQAHNHAARFVIGDIHLLLAYVDYIELSWPHNYECMTFLTPESSHDDSWKTLIQPFSGSLWLGVVLSLVLVGTIFYIISFLNAILMHSETENAKRFFRFFRKHATNKRIDPKMYRDARFRSFLNRYRNQRRDIPSDIFDSYGNCILLTYSMLLYVSLPRVPINWPLRVLTGWYWIYCILLTVTYRASFTAILANPAARITIDTLEDLVASRVKPIAWGIENKQFFLESFDEIGQKIGAKMDIIESNEEITTSIAKGDSAYYDNVYFLRYLRVQDNKRRIGTEVLHIMRDCSVNMPVAIGLEKHSPLKKNVDKNILHLIEGGLVSKWLKNAIAQLPAEEDMPQEAIINLSKFWSSFVALASGYFLGFCALLVENWHFKYVICKHPLYDVYNPKLYYNFKKLFPNS